MLVKGELHALDRQLQTAARRAGTRREHAPALRRCARRDRDHSRSARAAAGAGSGAAAGGCGVVAEECGRPSGGMRMSTIEPSSRGRSRSASAVAFVAGASALAAAAGRLRPGDRAAARRSGRGGRAAGRAAARPRRPAAVRRGHHERREDRRRHLQGASHHGGHRDKLFYEIPKNELDKDFLWNTQLKKTTIGAGYGGQTVGSRVVRWVLKGDACCSQNIEYTLVADPANPLKDEANLPAIIRDVPRGGLRAERRSRDRRDAAVHDATCRSSRRAAASAAAAWMRRRTFLEKAVSYPDEHQRRSDRDVHDGAGRAAAAAAGGAGRRRPRRRRGAVRAPPCSCTTA